MLITKSLPLSSSNLQFKAEDSQEFSGYAAVYNGVDSYGDTILPGAFDDTLSKHGLPKMFFNHQANSIPIGVWKSAEDDDTGLRLTGEFTPGNQRAAEVRAALKHGSMDGLSIGFRLSDDDYEKRDEGGRDIKRITQLVETSVVSFPADKAARVMLDSVKSEIDALESVAELEAFLCDVCALEKSAALHLIEKSGQLSAAQQVARDVGSNKANELLAYLSLRARSINHLIDRKS